MFHKSICLFLILSAFLFPAKLHAKIYRWVDEKGVSHFTNDEQHIPDAYRSQVIVNKEFEDPAKKNTRTVVHFERSGNAVLVNGVINQHYPVLFVLDTGATNTQITEEDARQLQLDTANATRVPAYLADGRKVEFPLVKLRSLRIGNAEVRNLEVLVGQVRLLGLSFLNTFKMTMDGEHGQLILDQPEKKYEKETEEISEEKDHMIATYEAKKEKEKILQEQVNKNIQFVETEISKLEQRRKEYRSRLRDSNNDVEILQLKDALAQIELALESYQLKIDGYKKDIEVLENNLKYYEGWINKLK
ncbi:MAG: retroviral-like aspartic protease family protein [Candidatus Schekmanbacteria bacterium]|nr:retroviral-like aspartic protease family protein [Candidatus Schekmanbacteria bacterium]